MSRYTLDSYASYDANSSSTNSVSRSGVVQDGVKRSADTSSTTTSITSDSRIARPDTSSSDDIQRGNNRTPVETPDAERNPTDSKSPLASS